MKKPDFLNKLTIIDIIIIVVIILGVCVAVLHISPVSNQSDSSTYDSSTIDKVNQKYLSLYNEGFITKTKIDGMNSSNGENVSVEGTIIWCDDNNNNKNLRILVDDDGNKIFAGTYKYNPNADVYINQMTLESDGDKYNITELTLSPIDINNFKTLTKGIENYNNYEITTTISLNDIDAISYQNILNAEISSTKKPCITISSNDKIIRVVRANNKDIKLADDNYKSFEGKTEPIKIRIYNCTDDELNEIKTNFNVTNIRYF